MERQSPPTERVIKVLNFLAERSHERFSLSELTRQVDLSKPTCLGIVAALTRAGYLDRDPMTKKYGLGPALIATGRAAEEGFLPLQQVRAELTHLSGDTGFACTATALAGNHAIVLERTGPPCAYDPVIQVGQRFPLSFSPGKWLMVWCEDDVIERWLSQLEDPLTPAELTRFHALIAFTRQHGYLVERLNQRALRFQALLAQLGVDRVPGDVLTARGEFVDDDFLLSKPLDTAHSVGSLAAPVYDKTGMLKLIITVYVLREITSRNLHRYTSALLTASGSLTAKIGGRNPWQRES